MTNSDIIHEALVRTIRQLVAANRRLIANLDTLSTMATRTANLVSNEWEDRPMPSTQVQAALTDLRQESTVAAQVATALDQEFAGLHDRA
jgi:hypothetical protein